MSCLPPLEPALGMRLLILTEKSLLDKANEADFVVKGNWLHSSLIVE